MGDVFCDSSSAILLEKTDLFESLCCAASIVFSKSVFEELTQAGYPDAAVFQTAAKKGIVKIQSFIEKDVLLSHPPTAQSLAPLGRGEKETLSLFLLQKKGLILIDDGKAARICDQYGLPFINALLVPKLFFYAGMTDQADCIKQMAHLEEIGRYSARVKAIAADLTENDLLPFLQELHP